MNNSIKILLTVILIFALGILITFIFLNLNLVKPLEDSDTNLSVSDSTVIVDDDTTSSEDDISDDNLSEVDDTETTSSDVVEEEPVMDIDTDAWNLILASEASPTGPEFPVELATLSSGYQVDARIVTELNAMIDAAAQDGYTIMVASAYRSYDYQAGLFANKVERQKALGYNDEEAVATAKMVVAQPGTSEHQTGLALDLVTPEFQRLEEEIETRPEIQWLFEHCYEYGFVLRYPKEKTEITGIIYEPWHYRYVGVEAATYMTQNNLTLEEYLALDEQ